MGARSEKPPALAASLRDGESAAEAQKDKKEMGTYLRIFSYAQPIHLVMEAVGIVAAIGSGVALAMMNLIIGNNLGNLSSASGGASIPDDFMDTVQRYSLYFVYIGIARFACTYIYSTLMTWTAFNITRNIRHAYLRAALSQEVSFFDKGARLSGDESSGGGSSISASATSNGKLIQSGIAEKLGQVFQAMATFVAAFVIAFTAQWKLTLILICIPPTLFVTIGGLASADAKVDTDIIRVNGQGASFAESVLGAVRTIQAFNLRGRLVKQYMTYTQKSRDLGRRKNWLYGWLFGLEYTVIFAGTGLAFWQGVAMLARGEIDNLGTVFTVLFSIIIAAISVTSLAPHLLAFGRATSAAEEMFRLIDRASEIDPFSTAGAKPEHTTGAIELSGVDFAYPTRLDVAVLKNFSLCVPAGKVTALVGPSGSGKSTIIGLLERWYNPTAGSIRLDDTEIKDLNLSWLRTNVRLVQQEPVLFNATVFENIAYGLVGTKWESAPEDERLRLVKQAAVTAFADDFVSKLPNGYDTRIGERGGLLSGGQKQRIAIARSIVSSPKILLLDEATSALDPHAEGIVQEALDRASEGRTTIVVAHKLKTIRNADNIVVLRKGEVVEQGRHEELVATGGVYASLVRAQNLSSAAQEQAQDSSVTDDSSLEEEQDRQDENLDRPKSLVRWATAEVRELGALAAKEDFAAHKQTGLLHTLVRLFIYTWDLKWWYALVLLSTAGGAATYPGQALLLAQVMDVFSAPPDQMVRDGNFISLMFFVMGLGSMVVYFGIGWSTNVIAQTLGQRVRNEILDHTLMQDLRFFDRPENTVGAITSRLASYPDSILELMGFNVGLMIVATLNVLASAALSIAVSWRLGLVGVFAGIPPLLLAGYGRIRVETKMDADVDKKFSASASLASETVTAIRTVSSLAIEGAVLKRYTDELDAAVRGSRRPLFTMMVWFSFTQAVEYFILALGFWWGAKLLSQVQITFYQFMVSFMGVFFSGQGAGMLFSYSSSFTKANHAANYWLWLLSLKPIVQQTDENKDRGPRDGCRSIDFDHAQFSYPLAPDNRVLKGISLKIEPGQFVAFVGASGCGKSTMVSLLLRFYDPTSGTVLIDEKDDLRNLNPWLYRHKVAFVQQEPMLFPGSIRENVSMGIDFDLDNGGGGSSSAGKLPTADEAALEKALRAANAWDFVSSLPEGLNTPCGTSGSQLSGGQRQRIAIARALVRNPAVLLLDEATSALDTESERVVQAALMQAAVGGRGDDEVEGGEKTKNKMLTIAVAHRLSTVRDADRIFVFYNGRIAEAGTHDELVARPDGMYRAMCEAQSLDQSTG